ncbi:MAG: tetratricopeptide repeat protein, partial [Limisphaerales bacterium]
ERKSKTLNEGKAVSLPDGAPAEIKILEGIDSVAFFGGDSATPRDDSITIPAKVAIPIILLLFLLVLAIKFWPERDHQAEGREQTIEMRAQIEQRMADLRASVDPVKPDPESEPVGSNSSSSSMPVPSLTELIQEGRATQRSQAFVGTNVVTVEFPALPETILRSVTKYEDAAYQIYVETALQVPYRLFGDTVFDLRTLGFALRRGMTEFTNNWQLVGGGVTRRTGEGLFLRLDSRYFLESRVVYVDKFPPTLELVADASIGVLGRKSGTREMEVSEGETKTVEVYAFGSMPSKAMVDIVQMKALEREKLVRNEIASVERKKAEKTHAEEEAKKRANDQRAVAYLRRRIKQGSASALYSLGVRHLDGSGVPKNRNEAIRLIREAARKGVSQAKKKLKELEK